MRVAVTGAAGFVGRHMVHELVRTGHTPVALSNTAEGWDLEEPVVLADLTRGWPPEVGDADAIVHLAGLSAVGPSFADPQHYLEVNSALLTTMCEALLVRGATTRVLVVSSGAVYDASAPQPIDEGGALALTSPYVVSKLLVEQLAAYYAHRGLDVVVVRPFNHIGPGQGAGFLVPDLAAEATAAAGEQRPMRVGDLGTSRDYTDVRDVVAAYALLLQADLGEDFAGDRVFNLSSGVSRSGEELCDLVVAALGLADLERQVDPARIRPSDPRSVRGDSSRLERLTGWSPGRDVEQSVRDYVAGLPCRG